jgi:CHAT domain-containing protein
MDEIEQGTAQGYLAKATTLWYQGRPSQALDFYARADASLTPSEAVEFIVKIKHGYAICLREVGQAHAALELYPQLETLCEEGGIDLTKVLRSWAIALEQVRDFGAARGMYNRIKPDEKTSQLERLKWEHAIGLLNWNEGRLTEAVEHLCAATALLPSDAQEAANYLAVLGNDARLSLYLGNAARAYRLVNRMVEIRQQVETVPLASETNLAIIRAALAGQRGDYAQEAAILKDGMDWITRNDPDEWIHKLDLAALYATAEQRAGPSDAAISYLSALCEAAPVDLAWVGSLMLAQLQLETKDFDGAKRNAELAAAFLVGSGTPESEAEIIATLASVAHFTGKVDAAAFLGKLGLKYLAQLIHLLDADGVREVIEESEKLILRIKMDLRSAGRFQEVAIVEAFFERVRRYALVLHKSGSDALAFQPIPFDQSEMQMEADWLNWRQELASLRKTALPKDVVQRTGQVVDKLFAFKTTSGLAQRQSMIAQPATGRLRLSFLFAGDACELQIQSADKLRTVPIDQHPSTFFNQVATLREALSDPEAWRSAAFALYQHLILPIEHELNEIDCLEIDAAGVLGLIPMGLLTDGDVCLVQRVAIRYVLNVEQPIPSLAPRCGLLHFAAFSSGALAVPPLFLHDVNGAFEPPALALGPKFTRARAVSCLQQKPAYLSVATHLEREPTRPDLSTLLLGDQTSLYLSDFAGDQFDLNGISVALFATCSSGVDDTTQPEHSSLAALVLEKGANCFVGTLWDISETAAADSVEAFWQAFGADPSQDPAKVLATLQARKAEQMQDPALFKNNTGGIGSHSQILAPENWAAFAIFENCNQSQQRD